MGMVLLLSLSICLALLDSPEEQEAFIAFYRRYRRLVLWEAKQIVKTQETAEDVAQNVFEYAAKNFSKFRSGNDTRTARLVVLCTRSRALDLFRKETAAGKELEAARQDCQAFEKTLDAEEVVLRAERVEQMINVIAALPETYRLPLELKLQEYSDEEICALLALSLPTLYKRLQRAYAAVRERMETDDGT